MEDEHGVLTAGAPAGAGRGAMTGAWNRQVSWMSISVRVKFGTYLTDDTWNGGGGDDAAARGLEIALSVSMTVWVWTARAYIRNRRGRQGLTMQLALVAELPGGGYVLLRQ